MAAVLTAATLTTFDVQGALGQLPKLPAVPPVPELQRPVELPRVNLPPVELPPVKVPQAPVPLPEVRAPAPKVPGGAPSLQVPGASESASPGRQPGPPAGAPNTTTGASDAAGSDASTARRTKRSGVPGRAQRGQRLARRDRAPRTKRERDLRTTVTGLWACSYAVNSLQRQVLQRRAGLDGHAPTSVRGTARALDLSSRAVRRAQRTGLRGLRRAHRSDGCAMGAGPQGAAREVQGLVAVATAPALRPVADIGGRVDSARRVAQTSGQGEGAVLGQRSSSAERATPGEGEAGPAGAQLAAAGQEGLSPFPLLALALVLAGGAVLMLFRRGHGAPAAMAGAVAPPPAPTPAPRPLEPEPAIERAPEFEPLPPGPDPVEQTHSARRAAGLAASGLASVAIGLLVRARRRR